jgi:hypothetical protein
MTTTGKNACGLFFWRGEDVKAVNWSPKALLVLGSGVHAAIDCMAVSVQRGERVRVQIERSELHQILGKSSRVAVSAPQFREGCIKVVESAIWPLPQRARVLAEIHRRLDEVLDLDRVSVRGRSSLASIYDFAAAWALAARLMQAGLTVSVLEHGLTRGSPCGFDENRADVDIVIPSDAAKGS